MLQHVEERGLAHPAWPAQQQVLLTAGFQLGEDILEFTSPAVEVARVEDRATELVWVLFDPERLLVQVADVQPCCPAIAVLLTAPIAKRVFEAEFRIGTV